ncbi:hypothetical protein V5799_000692 [Amblyomma americanum]|uniref:Uncharacterized protein n=1 Tax=Amblyomma americanum TaxID=6943 RepID=A0AAQ4D2B8_AMBAM
MRRLSLYCTPHDTWTCLDAPRVYSAPACRDQAPLSYPQERAHIGYPMLSAPRTTRCYTFIVQDTLSAAAVAVTNGGLSAGRTQRECADSRFFIYSTSHGLNVHCGAYTAHLSCTTCDPVMITGRVTAWTSCAAVEHLNVVIPMTWVTAR